MNAELLKAMKLVVKYLDDQMEVSPNRELADTSNYLQAIVTKEEQDV